MVDIEVKYYKYALILSFITVFYNIIEGLVSIYFGINDETIALFGFGADSFIETISGIGIIHMVYRIKKNKNSSRDKFEKTALKITGAAFYMLTGLLFVSAILAIFSAHKPETTFWGIVISAVSILSMFMLIKAKIFVGKKLNSDAIIADANCTKVCLYMSVVLLLSSGLYEMFDIAYFDSIGALILAYLSFKEGKESFEKSKSNANCSCSSCH